MYESFSNPLPLLLPKKNLRNLMLRPDVVEAVRAGRFHIYATPTVDEGIEVLTGMPAGEHGADGAYPPDSVNGRAEQRLREYAEKLRGFYRDGA